MTRPTPSRRCGRAPHGLWDVGEQSWSLSAKVWSAALRNRSATRPRGKAYLPTRHGSSDAGRRAKPQDWTVTCAGADYGVPVGGKAMILRFSGKSRRNYSIDCYAVPFGPRAGRIVKIWKGETSYTPGSVVPTARMAIHLDLTLPPGSSSLPEGFGRAVLRRLLLGLAPDEACHAANCYQRPGGLLRHRFTLTGQRPAVCSLLRYLSGCPGRTLSAIVLCGARKFLNRRSRSRPSRGLKRTTIARCQPKRKRKKTFLFSGCFSMKQRCCGYNDDYQTAMQLVGPYIAGSTA